MTRSRTEQKLAADRAAVKGYSRFDEKFLKPSARSPVGARHHALSSPCPSVTVLRPKYMKLACGMVNHSGIDVQHVHLGGRRARRHRCGLVARADGSHHASRWAPIYLSPRASAVAKGATRSIRPSPSLLGVVYAAVGHLADSGLGEVRPPMATRRRRVVELSTNCTLNIRSSG